MITVANKKHGATGDYVGRPSLLGNPFRVGVDGDRDEVIEKYRTWLIREFKAASKDMTKRPIAFEFLKLVQKHLHGEDITLVCWCAPEPCHAHVIKDLILRFEKFLHRKHGEGGPEWDAFMIEFDNSIEQTLKRKEDEMYGQSQMAVVKW